MGWVKPQAVFDGVDLRTDVVLLTEEEQVREMRGVGELDPNIAVAQQDVIVGPGLFDIQVNGGGGVMLNNMPTIEGVRTIALAHRAAGSAFLLPTVITDKFEVMQKAAISVLEEHRKNGVLGVHLEGPHINPAMKGTHNAAFIRALDERTFDLCATLRGHGLPVLLTLAPEMTQPGDIARLDRMGVVVSAGHSAATAAQTEAALAEGLRCFTHLFNAMPQLTSRNPGIITTAINSDAWCGIIADGHHVDHGVLAMAIRARPRKDRMILVSDAMATIGGPDHFDLYGERIEVQEGRLVNAKGALAGAHVDLKTCVQRTVTETGCSLPEALTMATTAPRQLMKIAPQALIGATLAELCVFEAL